MDGVAAVVHRDLALVLGAPPQLRVRGWDGSVAGPPGCPTLVIRTPRALRRLVWQPNDLGLGRAFITGELDVEGDLYEALRAVSVAATRPTTATARRRLQLAADAARVRALGPEPAPPPEEVTRLPGRRHSPDRDRRAVSAHYDVGNAFYRRVLGPSMVYSCAYWPEAGGTLEQAQEAKLELICRKLGLRPGMRLLDVGCGWGSLLLHAARHHGVTAVGVTLSREQAALARERVAAEELADRVVVRLEDYRDVADGPYDAISSVGMAEHVGQRQFGGYARHLAGLLRPGGRLLNHQIARPVEEHDRTGEPPPPRRSFLQAFVFPDGELLPLGTTVAEIEHAGLEVRDVEALREHYALTLRAWVSNLREHWDEAVRLTSEARARVWLIYMVASAVNFELGRLGVNQVLAVRPTDGGGSGLPRRRATLLDRPAVLGGDAVPASRTPRQRTGGLPGDGRVHRPNDHVW